MPNSNNKTTTVSACGKVLLVGGYLVLESPNDGLVLAVNKRFYTTIVQVENEESTTTTTTVDNADSGKTLIIVKSPQFHTEWKYIFNSMDGILEPMTTNPSINPFVEKTLTLLCLYRSPTVTTTTPSNQLIITIQADNDFYSVLPHLQQNQTAESDNNNNTIRTVQQVQSLPKCLPCPKDATTGKVIVHKTGLGSSAALTTSLVGAWLEHFGLDPQIVQDLKDAEDDDDDNDNEEDDSGDVTSSKNYLKDFTHNLAQMCHCWAQGKIGSGFDVSAAVYGTHVYQRFPKCLLSDFLQQLEHEQQHVHINENETDETKKESDNNAGMDANTTIIPDTTPPPSTVEEQQQQGDDENNTNNTNIPTGGIHQGAIDLLHTLVETIPWKIHMQRTMDMPSFQNIQLILADVHGGSESPSMAKQVLQWKQMKPTESKPLWKSLQQYNHDVIIKLQQLAMAEKEQQNNIDYDALSHQPSELWPNKNENDNNNDSNNNPVYLLKELSDTFRQIRTLLKQMGQLCADEENANGVPIEPDEQTALCDATMALPGVIAAVVPGAGGYDAIACLYINRPHVVQSIETLWSSFEYNNNNNNDKKKNTIICPLAAQVSQEGLRVETNWTV